MALANRMSRLLDKIERRLELTGLQLPDNISKDKWVKIIEDDTLPTFSHFYPHKVTMNLGPENRSKREKNTYIIDESYFGGEIKFIGFRDLNWANLINNINAANTQYGVYGMYDGYDSWSFEDVTSVQMAADSQSLYNSGIYPDFEAPNKIKFLGAMGDDIGSYLRDFPIDIFVEHPSNLQTIEPTKMDEFEKLAIDDVAVFLYGVLKYYDNIPTIFGSEVDLKLDKIKEKADDRDNLIEMFHSQYVSFANKNQPMIIST